MTTPHQPRGRGAVGNPANRFLKHQLDETFFDDTDPEPAAHQTVLVRDDSQSVLSENQSPDIGFRFSLNPYRGCEHGCAYCYARPTHEYLGLSAGLDFERIIHYKPDAARHLSQALSQPSWKPEPITLSGVTDPYQPVENDLGITRQCLEVFVAFRQPVILITKNRLILRDLDVLQKLARFHAVRVCVSITTLDSGLARALEPRTATPSARLDTVRQLRDAGISAGVLTAPMIPGLNDHELPALLDAAGKAGAEFARYTMIRLPFAVAPLFEDWLRRHRPLAADKILNRIREIRGGRLNVSTFGERLRGAGPEADRIRQLFHISRKRAGFPENLNDLSCGHFRRHDPRQPELDLDARS